MPWNHQLLALTATPASVRTARDWVARALDEIGRPELADSARLAVSELVTNAILHAEPPVTVRLRGTIDNPRVEVADRSIVPPQRQEADTGLMTVGRGLDLVASHSRTWGSEIVGSGDGKVVWFEPSPAAHDPVEGQLFDIDAMLAELGEPEPDPDTMVTVEFLDMPARLFARLRTHFAECAREMRLLAISDPKRYPLEVEISRTCLQIEHERRRSSGTRTRTTSPDGHEIVNLSYVTPPTAPATMSRLLGQLDELYQRYDDEMLLTVRPHAVIVDLQRWFLGEFGRQTAGEPPLPWDGPIDLPEH